MELQGYIDATYERLVERLGEPNIFYEWTFEGYDVCGEEFDITIVGQHKDTIMWHVVSNDPSAMKIVEQKIQPVYCEKLP